ncbi:MAG: A/G-specific adenine glycosylase, partial [Deltaproteobacteria bacterium]
MATAPFGNKIVSWYRENKRAQPWREQPDGYAVGVSEIMLQQTRVETVIPYFAQWMKRFPTVEELAAASQQEVLAEWEGLGYYSRARNLHRAAKVVVVEYGGNLPDSVKGLRRLPGVGRYTAGALASIVYGLDEPVVDGNVKRVMARVFNVEEPVDSSRGEGRIWGLAGEHLPSGQASEYNQGLMELGARVCTPKNPNCVECPLSKECRAYALGIQAERPVRKPKPAIPTRKMATALIREGENVLMRQRPEDGLLGGMWEFPSVRVDNGAGPAEGLEEGVREEMGVEIRVDKQTGTFQHAYTHFRVKLLVFECELAAGKG